MGQFLKRLLRAKNATLRKLAHAPTRRRAFHGAVETLESRLLLFNPYTHVETAKDVLEDVADGMVTIADREYPVREEVADALQDPANRPFLNFGVMGDDFPDTFMSQSVIHPQDTGLWLRRIYEKAWEAQSDPQYSGQESQILAASYGFLVHAAGDVWSHTLVNDFSEGVFPPLSDIPGDPENLARAIRHIIVEAYIADATPGFDGNRAVRTTFAEDRDCDGIDDGGIDTSDDSTPALCIDAPHRFIYETLINPDDPEIDAINESRGFLVDYFINKRDDLQAMIDEGFVDPVEEALEEFDDTVARVEELENDCIKDFDFFACAWDLLVLPFEVAGDAAEAVVAAGDALIEDAWRALRNAYADAWIDDIDQGLERWSEFGAALSRGLRDPQARRDEQNEMDESDDDGLGEPDCGFLQETGTQDDARATCEAGVGVVDVILEEVEDFVVEPMLSMLGAPDWLDEVVEAVSDFTQFIDELDNLIDPDFIVLREIVENLRAAAKNWLHDRITEALGFDPDVIDRILSSPAGMMDLPSITVGDQTIGLFQPDDHERLDQLLGLPPDHHEESLSGDVLQQLEDLWGVDLSGVDVSGVLRDDVVLDKTAFRAYANTVTTAKLALLDGETMDQVLRDLTGLANYQLYTTDGDLAEDRGGIGAGDLAPGGNVMISSLPGVFDPDEEPALIAQWLRSIDGDHAWRADGHADNEDAPSGNGNFPLWESCMLRDPVFRVLFQDWENGGENFPDAGDLTSHDPNEIPPTVHVVGNQLVVIGTPVDDHITVSLVQLAGGERALRVEWEGTRTYCAGSEDVLLSDLLAPQRIFVYGRGGDDYVEVELGMIIQAGTMPYTIPAELYGGRGNDELLGGSGADIISGGDAPPDPSQRPGGNPIPAGPDDDLLHGRDGDDTYLFYPGDLLGSDVVEEAPEVDIDTLIFSRPWPIRLDLSNTQPQEVSPGHLTLTLTSATGVENVTGSDAADNFTGNSRDNVLRGMASDDFLVGAGGNDVLTGLAGQDTFEGGPGDDQLDGGSNNDTYRFIGALLGWDSLIEAAGANTDTLDFSAFAASVTLDLTIVAAQTVNVGNLVLTLSDTTGFENVMGSPFDDRIRGNSRDNLLLGGSGHDILSGLAGNDVFEAGQGDDRMVGGWGNDTFRFAGGMLGSDVVDEAAGVNTDSLDFSAFVGPATVDLSLVLPQVVNPGNLVLRLTAATGIENVVGSLGDDRTRGNIRANVLSTGLGKDMLEGAAGDDLLEGGPGSDTYRFVGGLLGSDIVNEAANLDSDTLDFTNFIGPVAIDLSSILAQPVNVGNLMLSLTQDTGLENVVGSALADNLRGNSRDNQLRGGPGNDILEGAGGNDALVGEAGSDSYRFVGGLLGSDRVEEAESPPDIDTLDFAAFVAAIVLDLSSAAAQIVNAANLALTLSVPTGLQNVLGSAFGDQIRGNIRNNSLAGNGGDDVLFGGDGQDNLSGGAGHDALHGEVGDDVLIAGVDALVDDIFGELGRDTFQCNAAERRDFIAGVDVFVATPL